MTSRVKKCRACGAASLEEVFKLGNQALSGVFRSKNIDDILAGPLNLCQCAKCSLVQLQHSYPLDEMYNESYGYRSGATAYMKNHLNDIIEFAKRNTSIEKNDYVLDIGCNDGTLLGCYSSGEYNRIGIDPVAKKYLDLYENDIKVVTDFFSMDNYFSVASQKATIITSISMFYDLEEPLKFSQEIAKILDIKGVWVFEQSYLPAMLRQNSYDTICHEHLEYYSLNSIEYIMNLAGLTIIDASQNEVNGGSIRLAAVRLDNPISNNVSPEVISLLEQEKNHNIHNIDAFTSFQINAEKQKIDLVRLLQELKKAGKTVVGYGASTKGNVILQYCNITTDLLPCIGDITPFKDGTYTPGTKIPIISMEKAKAMRPDYFLVLPWGFRSDIILREKKDILKRGGKLIFPLPFVEIVN